METIFISYHCIALQPSQMELNWNFNQSEFCLLSILYLLNPNSNMIAADQEYLQDMNLQHTAEKN